MSALTVSLAAYDAQHPPSPTPVLPVLPIDEQDDDSDSSPGPSPPPSSSPSSSQLSTLTSSSSVDSSSSAMSIRANEHLAVLLPRHLWKEDALAAVCDNFYCRVRFSIFERRHHCRKCGSIFCGACTAHTTALLDTSSPALPFTHPPHRTPIALYASKDSPVLDNARVCTACFAQIHGLPQRERTPELVASRTAHAKNNNSKSKSMKAKPSISSLTSTTSASSSGSSSGSSSDAPRTPSSPSSPSSPTLPAAPHTRTRTRSRRRISLLTSTQPTLPADVLAALSSLSHHPHHNIHPHHHIHTIHSSHACKSTTTNNNNTTPNSTNHNTNTSTNAARAVSPIHAPDDPLAVYPLTRHSAVCKAMGGGRWTPAPSSPHSPLHSPLHTSPLYTSPLHSPLLYNSSPYHTTNTGAWNEKHATHANAHPHAHSNAKGYFDLGEIVSDEAGFRYRRAPHVHIHRGQGRVHGEHGEEEGGEGVRPF